MKTLQPQHEPTDDCWRTHCHTCHRDEPVPPGTHPYITCFECGHVYLRARDLRRAHRHVLWRTRDLAITRSGWLPEMWGLLRGLLRPARHIYSCQHCSHDF